MWNWEGPLPHQVHQKSAECNKCFFRALDQMYWTRKTTHSTLLTVNVKAIISDVANTSRENFLRYPTRDANNKIFSSITTVIRGYKYIDPNTQHCDCLPLRVFKILLRKEDYLKRVIGNLASGAMFFGMRSYEYVTTTSSEDNNKKTQFEEHQIM